MVLENMLAPWEALLSEFPLCRSMWQLQKGGIHLTKEETSIKEKYKHQGIFSLGRIA